MKSKSKKLSHFDEDGKYIIPLEELKEQLQNLQIKRKQVPDRIYDMQINNLKYLIGKWYFNELDSIEKEIENKLNIKDQDVKIIENG